MTNDEECIAIYNEIAFCEGYWSGFERLGRDADSAACRLAKVYGREPSGAELELFLSGQNDGAADDLTRIRAAGYRTHPMWETGESLSSIIGPTA